ncbi:MAG: tRNA (adenosine(37)-N6)-threonylcarbamoyltransferase complex dimerization subunit type 1 TsaB [Acidaminococcaceae bacterium]
MLILGIDTATKVCTVSLVRDNEMVAEYEINAGMTHSEELLPQIGQLLERTKIDKKDIDLIAISIGPGSFTGLRIGLATAEAMAYSWQIPVSGVDTLKAMAYNLPVDDIVLAPVLDAQKGNYYLALYEWQNGELQEHQKVTVVSREEMITRLTEFAKPVIILGECAKLAKEELPTIVKLAPWQVRMPKASSVALLGHEEYNNGPRKDIFELNLHYIRRSEAEELWEKRQKKV